MSGVRLSPIMPLTPETLVIKFLVNGTSVSKKLIIIKITTGG
jgi:hypothetical protein